MGQSDYLTTLFSFDKYPPMAILCFFFLAIFRLAPIITFAPFLGSKLPSTVKMGIVISFAAILLPHMMLTAHRPIFFTTEFIGFALKEIVVGYFLAFLVAIPFYIAQSAGSLIDFLRGSSALQVTDPTTQAQASPIGLLYNYMLIVLFYQIDGPFILFQGLISSYDALPADALINPVFFTAQVPIWKSLMSILNKVLEVSVQLSAPSIVAILMTEFFLGVANRMAPNVQISFLGMSLKSLVGLMFLAFGWLLITQQLGKQALLWLQQIANLIDSLKPFALLSQAS